MLYADVISFSATRKCKKTRKINENCKYRRRNSSYFLNDLTYFKEIFRKNVAYDNIKNHKKSGFEKTTGGG